MFAWNAVKTFYHTFVENKSNDMSAKFGVFIRSAKSNDDIIEACRELVRSCRSGGKITAVRNDKIYGGVKVYLNAENVVQELLDKQFLYESGENLSTIHPLTTHLIVHDAIISTTEEEFSQELGSVIKDALGPVLNVSQIPASKNYPDIGSGNWKVHLDIPEIEDLDVYKRSGLPDNFTINVPGVHERLSVTFYCSKCEKHGHTQWRCPESVYKVTESISQSTKQKNSASVAANKPTIGFHIRDRDDENKEIDLTSKNKPSLKRKKIKEFERVIGKEEVRSYCDSFHLMDIKKEAGDFSSSDRNSGRKKARISFMNCDDGLTENLPKASSTTNDTDTLQIVNESPPSTPSKNQLSKIGHYFPSSLERGSLSTSRNAADDSVSTSNQPAATTDSIKSELPSTDENDSDSNLGPSASAVKPVRQRKKPAQGVPIVIPDRIQTIISNIEGGVLNVEQLTAFFNHVKKKSRPCNFAKMYTNDVVGLKKQLEEIKTRYYMIPERGTNAEIQFMKWFASTLERFDGTPSTRKRKTTT